MNRRWILGLLGLAPLAVAARPGLTVAPPPVLEEMPDVMTPVPVDLPLPPVVQVKMIRKLPPLYRAVLGARGDTAEAVPDSDLPEGMIVYWTGKEIPPGWEEFTA